MCAASLVRRKSRGSAILACSRLASARRWCMTSADHGQPELPPCGCSEPGLASASVCYCGVEDLLRVIRRRYSLAVLNAIHTRGQARYHDLAAALPAASSSTLAETLHALDAARLVDRRQYSEERPHTVYSLTESGTKLLSRLRQLLTEIDLT
ncbi:MAG: winged helix-turn-helix transcriptional regulator [Gemmatimonadaceae bacterium]